MNNLGQRIRARREELGLTQEQVAQQVGIKQQSYQAIESGSVKKPRHLYEISVALQCDMAWLLSGKDKDVKNVEVIDFKTYQVPLISYVQAGLWTESCELRDSTGFEYIMTSLELSDEAFALKIKGDSMEPEFKEGDVVIIDPAIKPMPGEFVVAVNGEEDATFKKYRELGHDEHERMQFELIPLNPDYTTMSSLKQQIRVIGTMVEHRIFRRKR
ncbi:DNA-binding protein [Gilliamella apicola]|jgi:SOS-response transcriptional repressors (RecA-mediated autopeptidases)|uniref:DNA-binding protein n=1 Tax=Gilliamella apicola TaxID=1196095 RepID=A0A2V4DZJ3_9GAMM|nr:LexA family transcriptional regulator [Gilliamella apicola]PXZ06332.1 DNA-binding protein [Gilliamella apicola]